MKEKLLQNKITLCRHFEMVSESGESRKSCVWTHAYKQQRPGTKFMQITCTKHDFRNYCVIVQPPNHNLVRTEQLFRSKVWKRIDSGLFEINRKIIMADTTSCMPETAPLLNFHFRTRKASKSDVLAIAKMIKVRTIHCHFFFPQKMN